MLDFFENSVKPAPLPGAKPQYDPTGLGFAVPLAGSTIERHGPRLNGNRHWRYAAKGVNLQKPISPL
jgi:hypothetical protein